MGDRGTVRDQDDTSPGIDTNVDTFKLLVSTEPVDDFLLMQPELELGKILSSQDLVDIEEHVREEFRKITNDWFTKTLTVKTVRQPNRLGDKGGDNHGEH